MTIPNAGGDNRLELFAPRTERPADMPAASPKNDTSVQKPLEPFETTQTPAGAEGAPYELELRGELPKLKFYTPFMKNSAPQGGYETATPQSTRQPEAAQNAPQELHLPGENEGEGAKTMEEISEETKCPVCENRKYQDGSTDPGVSLKFATKLSPYSATSAVRAHEYQHVRHHQMEADKEDRKVISQTVMLRTRRCPHCGKMYTAGGTTKTVTAAYSDCAHMSAGSDEGQLLDKCV